MVWIPDPLVVEFFTRDTAPDASNRARHHCNACTLSFPVGNNLAMRTHLFSCPSLPTSTVTSIRTRIAAELASPKRVTRDPRWTKTEEATLLSLDSSVPSGKREGKYQIMSERIGRSAQACRQKLIHLKENEKVDRGEQEMTKRVLWKRKVDGRRDGEEGMDMEFEDAPRPARATRAQKVVREKMGFDDDVDETMHDEDEKEVSPVPKSKSKPKRVKFSVESDATLADPTSRKTTSTPETVTPWSTITPCDTTVIFLRQVRWSIAQPLSKHNILRRFYTSDLPLVDGWDAFARSDIPLREKDEVVAKLIGLWLDGLDVEGFEAEVDDRIERVIVEMSDWVFGPQGRGNGSGDPHENRMEKRVRMAKEDGEDSGYDGEGES